MLGGLDQPFPSLGLCFLLCKMTGLLLLPSGHVPSLFWNSTRLMAPDACSWGCLPSPSVGCWVEPTPHSVGWVLLHPQASLSCAGLAPRASLPHCRMGITMSTLPPPPHSRSCLKSRDWSVRTSRPCPVLWGGGHRRWAWAPGFQVALLSPPKALAKPLVTR